MDAAGVRPRSAAVRRHFADLIASLQAEGDAAGAERCARLAVAEGVWRHPLQRPVRYLPELDPVAVHRPEDFWFTDYLSSHHAKIRAEVDGVIQGSGAGMLPVEEPLLRAGRWEQVVLYEGGHRFDEACRRFPVTAEVVEGIPEATHSGAGVVTLSWLYPGTHIVPHCGSTNARLRAHLGIHTPPGPRIRVGVQELRWREGECLVFDDSFEHEVWHDGDAPRLVLLLDVTHPGLTAVARDRLLAKRSTFADRVVAFMRENGLARVDASGAQVLMSPGEGVEVMIRRYLRELGSPAVELRDGRLYAIDGGEPSP